MSHFSLEAALAANTRLHAERMRSRSNPNTYYLYYANDPRNLGGRITGTTIKQLINEFRSTYGTYRFAFIVKKGAEDVVLRSYNVNNGKKFVSHTRKGGKRKTK